MHGTTSATASTLCREIATHGQEHKKE